MPSEELPGFVGVRREAFARNDQASDAFFDPEPERPADAHLEDATGPAGTVAMDDLQDANAVATGVVDLLEEKAAGFFEGREARFEVNRPAGHNGT